MKTLLDGLCRIGVDEVAYKRHHNYLTIVADHDTARVVWVEEGKRGAALESFCEALVPERRNQIEAVSMIWDHLPRRHSRVGEPTGFATS